MGKFVDNVKTGFWNLLNSPGTEAVEEEQSDDYYYEEERTTRSNDRGYRRDQDMYEDEYEHEPKPLRLSEKRSTSRQAQNNKVLELHGKNTPSHAEVVIRHPMDVGEAAKICDCVRDNKMCIIDLTGMDRTMAQRIADFLGGACYALDGSVQRVSKDIFVIVPDGVRIAADLQDELERDGYVFPSRVRR